MIENRNVHGVGLAVLIISSITPLFLLAPNELIFFVMSIIGTCISITAGILLLIGGRKNHKILITLGIIFGFSAVTLLLISSSSGIIYNILKNRLVNMEQLFVTLISQWLYSQGYISWRFEWWGFGLGGWQYLSGIFTSIVQCISTVAKCTLLVILISIEYNQK